MKSGRSGTRPPRRLTCGNSGRPRPPSAWRCRENGPGAAKVSGGVAQLAEHRLCKAGVRGSSPLASTRICPVHFVGAVGGDLRFRRDERRLSTSCESHRSTDPPNSSGHYPHFARQPSSFLRSARTAAGSGALVADRPTTMCVAPARIAVAGCAGRGCSVATSSRIRQAPIHVRCLLCQPFVQGNLAPHV
jgi:hypothetical protein